ncbi:hypothetical protein BD311DRAFT_769855 [Dichomitus squalens]|uniref:DUF6535 domain-containing protein n=1 Tax=Dichomitus squalens TaxID=114155 RepID=A0A4V2JYW9_9APHY|nr:hypothetical protein BD311DRAFT_769855 [Dichomitus squalens]
MTSPGTERSQIGLGGASESTPGQRQEPSTSNEASSSGLDSSQQDTNNGPNIQVSSAPLPWKLPNIEDLRKEFAETYTQAEKDKALTETAKVVKTYSDEMVKRWNEEIDNLLVYAGLFSSILTAFNVQSYLLLQPATPDPTLAVLQQISLQLNSFSVNPPGTLVNSTHPVTAFGAVQASPVESWAVWLNSLWFSALICSLSSASVGILVKQWLHEYQAGISGDSVEFARLRQYRLNHLEKWHVAEIVAVLPVLLQISLFLFFAGLLILLWHYHSTVAIVASVLIGVVTSFVVATTVMPTIWTDCCYLSPPTYAMFLIVQNVKPTMFRVFAFATALFRLLCRGLAKLALLPHPTRSWLKDRGVLIDKAALESKTRTSISLRGREQTAVHESSSQLDVDMVLHAYATTMDVRQISGTAVEVFLAEKPSDAIDGFYSAFGAINQQHFGAEVGLTRTVDAWTGALIHVSRRETINTLTKLLWEKSYSYRGSLTVEHYQRLLLALAATVANPESAPDAHRRSLMLLDELFTSNRAALELMPWRAVRHVTAVAETRLGQLLHPSDGEPAQEHAVFLWLRILVKCWFAPVSSWTRSQEETKAMMSCIFGMDLLQKGSISKIAGTLWWWKFAEGMLDSLDIILTYLGESEDARRGAPGDFLEAVGELVEFVEGGDSRYFWRFEVVQEALKKLKRSFERCKSLGLGVRAEEERI